MLGIKNWRDIDKYYSKISKETKRDQKQLKYRWVNYLELNCKKINWDIVEEYIFFEFRSKLGNRWSPIAKVIPSKSDNDIKNHFHSNLKKMFRKLLKKKFDISCIYEKIRVFYFMNYIKSKYENFVHYYDSMNNSINFDAIKEKTELITNVDDKAICDLVIDQKGSIKIVNNSLNEVCLMIISDPLTIQLVEKLNEKYLTKNIKNLKLFDFEEEESRILIKMIIKLHVFYNLKNFGRIEDIENEREIKTNGDTNHIKNNNYYKNEFFKNNSKALLKISNDYEKGDQKNQNKHSEEILKTFSYKDSNTNNFINNLENNDSKSDVYNKNLSFINLDKDNLLKNLTSNNFKEYNLQNFNPKEGLRNNIMIANYCKIGNTPTQLTKNLFNIIEDTYSESKKSKKHKKNMNLKEFSNFPINILDEVSKIRFNQEQSIENYNILCNNQNGKIIKSLNTNQDFKNNIFENKKFHNELDKTSSNTKIMEKVEYAEIIERFLESEELRCLLDERNLLNLQEDWKKKINKQIKKTNQLENLDSRYKNFFIEKLGNFQNAEYNQSVRFKEYNKFINIERKIDINKDIISCNKTEYGGVVNQENSNFINNKILNLKNNYHPTSHFYNNNHEKHNFLQTGGNQMNKNLYKNKNDNSKNNMAVGNDLEKKNNRLKESELRKKLLKNASLIKNDFLLDEKNKNKDITVKIFNKIFECQKIKEKKFKQIFHDPTDSIVNFVYKKEEKQTTPKISFCDDLKEKYPYIEEENILNTNYCYISNSLLDKLMSLKDPDIFLKIIEKIVVNNIVYSIFNKEKYCISSNLKFNNKNIAFIYTNRENDDNIINNKNALSSKYFADNSNKYIQIKSCKIDSDLKNFSSNFEDETFYNIYNKIKNSHNINKNKFENSINHGKKKINHLDLHENDSYNIRKNSKQNFFNQNENGMMNDLINISLDSNGIDCIKNHNGFANDEKIHFLLKNKICDLENEKIEENCNMNNLNSLKIVLNKNFSLKSNLINNYSANYEANFERYANTTFKDLEINNFNFHYDSKKIFLRKKKRAEY